MNTVRAMSQDNYDPNEPEIPEEDDPSLGAARVARFRHQNEQFRKLGLSQAPLLAVVPSITSSMSQSNTPVKTASTSADKPNTQK